MISNETFSCLLCGQTTHYPHICPVFQQDWVFPRDGGPAICSGSELGHAVGEALKAGSNVADYPTITMWERAMAVHIKTLYDRISDLEKERTRYPEPLLEDASKMVSFVDTFASTIRKQMWSREAEDIWHEGVHAAKRIYDLLRSRAK